MHQCTPWPARAATTVVEQCTHATIHTFMHRAQASRACNRMGPSTLLKPAQPTAKRLSTSCSRQHDDDSSPARSDVKNCGPMSGARAADWQQSDMAAPDPPGRSPWQRAFGMLFTQPGGKRSRRQFFGCCNHVDPLLCDGDGDEGWLEIEDLDFGLAVAGS